MNNKAFLLLLVVMAALLGTSCLSTSSGSSGDDDIPRMKDIVFEPDSINTRVVEDYDLHDGNLDRKAFDNLRSYGLKQYRVNDSTVALETLFLYQKESYKQPELAYEAMRELYRIDPEKYGGIFAQAAYVRALSKDSSEGEEILPLRAEAAMYAFRLTGSIKQKNRLLEFLGSQGSTSFQGYVLAQESGDEDLAGKFYDQSMELSPLYLAAYLENEGYREEADLVRQEGAARNRVNGFCLYLHEDFDNGPETWNEIDKDGILLKWKDGAWNYSNNRSPGANYHRLSYTPQKKYDGWNFMTMDFTDISANKEAAEYFVYYGNINIHVDREKGYRIDTKPSHVYNDLLVYQDWTPLPEGCGPGETFTLGIYPGEEEVLVLLGDTLIPLEGAYGKRADTLYIDLNPGSGCRIDNLNFYGMENPMKNLGALPDQTFAYFEAESSSASADDLERWLSDPFMGSHYFSEMLGRISQTHPDFSWLDYQRRAVEKSDFVFMSLLETYNRRSTQPIEMLTDGEISRLVRSQMDQSVLGWERGESNKTAKAYLKKLYGEYRTSPRWQPVMASESVGSSLSLSYLQNIRTDLENDKYDDNGLIRKSEYISYIDDLFNLGRDDMEAVWAALSAGTSAEERERYALSVYSAQEYDYTPPFTTRDGVFYREYFGEKSKWYQHEMESDTDYLAKIQDAYPSEGYLLGNKDNGDDSYNYFYVYNDIFSKKGCDNINDKGRWNTLDISLVGLSPLERNERDRGIFMGIEYNGLQFYLRDNREFRLIYLEPFKKNSTVVQEWTPYPSEAPEGSNRARISLYAGMDMVMVHINGESFGPYPEMPARKQGNTSKSYGEALTFYVWEDSSLMVSSLTARDSEYLVDQNWLLEIQETAYDQLAEMGDSCDWNALFRIATESYYMNRALFERIKADLSPHLSDRAVPWYVTNDEWRVLAELYGKSYDGYLAYMRDTADYVRLRLNDAFNDSKAEREVTQALNLFYNAYKDGFLFYDEVSMGLPRGIRATSRDFDSGADERLAVIRRILTDKKSLWEDSYWLYYPWMDDEYYLMNLCGLTLE